MSVGCLAFLRGLFADDNFIDQRFVPRKFEKNYNPDDPLMRSDSIRVKTLARGKSPQVDTFLDWIDKGVCDAIRKNYLEGLVLAIFLDENKPEDLHEVYTFSFDYKDNKVKLEMNSEQTETITLLDARQALQHLMRRFIIITQGLNPLPDKKFVTMRLLFNDSCPKKYQPECFKDASDRPVAMIKTKKSSLESYSAGIVSTGRHEYEIPCF
jgi:meiosis-specific protein HOP1